MKDLRQKSLEVLKAHQSPAGGFHACPDFPVYRYSWLRDGTFIAHALGVTGQHEAARGFHRWVGGVMRRSRDRIERLRRKMESGAALVPGDFPPARFLADGREQADDWPNFQLDGYGTWLWGLAEHVLLTGETRLLDELRDAIDLILDYLELCWRLPNYDPWEEHGDRVHTTTLACLAGGIGAIAPLLGDGAAQSLAREIWSHALLYGTVDGRLAKFCSGPVERRVTLDDPNANSPVAVGTEVDASHLWAVVPFGLHAPDEPIAVRTAAEIERTLTVGHGVHRYIGDTYYGGGCWPLLTAWLGWYHARAGRLDDARACLAWIEKQADEQGHLPEQVDTHLLSPADKARWENKWGPAAKPLLWSHAMYLILREELDGTEPVPVKEATSGCISAAADRKP